MQILKSRHFSNIIVNFFLKNHKWISLNSIFIEVWCASSLLFKAVFGDISCAMTYMCMFNVEHHDCCCIVECCLPASSGPCRQRVNVLYRYCVNKNRYNNLYDNIEPGKKTLYIVICFGVAILLTFIIFRRL